MFQPAFSFHFEWTLARESKRGQGRIQQPVPVSKPEKMGETPLSLKTLER